MIAKINTSLCFFSLGRIIASIILLSIVQFFMVLSQINQREKSKVVNEMHSNDDFLIEVIFNPPGNTPKEESHDVARFFQIVDFEEVVDFEEFNRKFSILDSDLFCYKLKRNYLSFIQDNFLSPSQDVHLPPPKG